MTREELIQFCHYYKGEEENPFEKEGGTKALLWNYENVWVNDSISNKKYLNDCLREYENGGLKSFKSNDGIPATLKSILFNRYCHWNGYGDVINGFKEWYNMYY